MNPHNLFFLNHKKILEIYDEILILYGKTVASLMIIWYLVLCYIIIEFVQQKI